jgi:hypothetical protein
MNIAATVDGTVSVLLDLNGEGLLVAIFEASFVGYIDAEIGVPLPTLYGEMNIKH